MLRSFQATLVVLTLASPAIARAQTANDVARLAPASLSTLAAPVAQAPGGFGALSVARLSATGGAHISGDTKPGMTPSVPVRFGAADVARGV